jgi:hypothetical protein
MTGQAQLVPFAIKTYRYLRLSIVVVVASLLASVLIEVAHAGCWQESISAYFYTPTHSIFVGGLVAIGVALIAVKGCTDLEDALLNVAGVLAPIVAFVPTTPPRADDVCKATGFIGGGDAGAKAMIDNNVIAFAIGGLLAIILTWCVGRFVEGGARPVDERPAPDPKPSAASIGIGLALSLVLLAIGLIWYFGFRDSFLDQAHGGAAGAMFGIVAVVMLINAFTARPTFRPWYGALFGTMVGGVVVALVGIRIDDEWRHQILVLEILELTPFAIYWVLQTVEHWDGGVPTGDERAARNATRVTRLAAPPP